MITENTKVKTLVERDGYPAGTIGIVVSLYTSGPACEVELWDETDYPMDVVTYRLCEVEAVVQR
jgi:hypothetical protein